MNHPPCNNIDVNGDASGRAGSPGSHQGFACPFVKSDPIFHHPCTRFMLRRVSDVKQHLRREHPEEARKVARGRGKKNTDEERWYALWEDLFPGRARPATPYAGTVVELFGALVTEYIEQQREEVSADGQTALMGCLAYIRARSLGMRPGNVSSQGATDVSNHQTRDIGIQDHTHQNLLLSTTSLDPIVGSFQPPHPPLVPTGHSIVPTFGAAIEPKGLSNPEANGQYEALLVDSNAHHSAFGHELLLNHGAGIGLANGYAGYQVVLWDPAGITDGDLTGNFQHACHDALWNFSQPSENGPSMM